MADYPKSQIPKSAREKVVERYEDGSPKITEYYLRKKLVGVRHWDPAENGGLVNWDIPFRNGVKHGLELTYYDDRIASVEPYTAGLVHGTARQFAPDGRLLGTYRLVRGTGIDLWRDCITGKLTEEYHYAGGKLVLGRLWNGDDRTVYEEYYCRPASGRHGIHREWGHTGRICRDFPKFYIVDKRVAKRQYLLACEKDPSLPRYLPEEDSPLRKLPRECAAQNKRRRPRSRPSDGEV